jgi:hypothetical protein
LRMITIDCRFAAGWRPPLPQQARATRARP